MDFEIIYLLAVVASSALGGAVAMRLYTADAAISTRLFVWLMALHSVVGLLVVGQLLTSGSIGVAIYSIQKAVAAGIMPLWFIFALTYTRRQNELPRLILYFVGGYYCILAGLEVTNPGHQLLRSSYEVVGTQIPHLTGIVTPVYSLLSLPLALFYFAGLSLFGLHALSGPTVTRRNSAYLFAGFLPVFLILTADIYQVLPGPIDGGVVIVSSWSLAGAAWVVFRGQEFDLIPLARETVFEAVTDAVVVVDAELCVVDYNDRAVEAFTQLDGSEGSPIADHLPALVTEDENTPFATSFTNEQADGVYHYDTTVSPLEISGTVRGYGLVLRDVTESRQQILELEQQTVRLERFASTLSHDIRNPLNVAEGRIELAIETGDISHLTPAKAAHERISRIIEDVLELTREGQRVTDSERVRVQEILRAAWEMTGTDDAMLTVEDGADIAVYADSTRLQRAFENIIRNAIEHGTPDGEGRRDGDSPRVTHDVTVTFGRHSNGFYIEDNGPGIPPEERDDVFEYEFTTTDTGTGLGLALVDEIARAHGWSVEMAEGSDGGARIVFSDVEVIDTEEMAVE
jgi:signal transduction histidine kinase